jgi:hypothetical protein
VVKATTELSDENLVSIWKKMIDDKQKLDEKINGYKEQMEINDNQTNEIVESIMQLHSKMLITEVIFQVQNQLTNDYALDFS